MGFPQPRFKMHSRAPDRLLLTRVTPVAQSAGFGSWHHAEVLSVGLQSLLEKQVAGEKKAFVVEKIEGDQSENMIPSKHQRNRSENLKKDIKSTFLNF